MKALLVILLASPLYASVNPCDGLPSSSLDQLDLNIAIPNCLSHRALTNARGEKRNTKLLCDCKNDFQTKSMLPIQTAQTKQKKQELFFKAMLDEFEKIQKNNLVDLVKLSQIDTGGSLKFETSLKACEFKAKESFTSGCGSKAAVALFEKSDALKIDKSKLSNEVLNLMAPLKSPPRQGLLNRTTLFANHSAQQCSLTEIEAMKFSGEALNAILAPEFIRAFKNYSTAHPGKSLSELFEGTGFDLSLKDLLLQHPLISMHMQSKDQFMRLMDSVAPPQSTKSLNDSLMNAENSTIFDKKLADSCATSFNNLKSSLCTDKFEEGEIELDPFGNLPRLGFNIKADLPSLAGTQEMIELNQQVLAFCPWENNSNAQNLTKSVATFDELIDSRYHRMSNEQFSNAKYVSEISTARDQICEMKNESKPCASFSSLVERHQCMAAQLWRESHARPSPVSPTLADRPIAQLIRGLLPPLETLDAPTKNELARIGIIPLSKSERPSAAQVAQAAAQVERFNPQFTSSSSATLPRQRSESQTNARAQEMAVSPSAAPITPQQSNYSAQLAEVMGQKQKMFEESNETYRSVIDELIKRRLDKPSKAEVTKAVQEEFQRTSTPFDPRSREGQSFINNIVNNYPAAVRTNNPQVISRPFEQERVAEALNEAIAVTNAASQNQTNRTMASTDIKSVATSARLTSSAAAGGIEKVVVTDPKLNLNDPGLPQLLQSVLTLNENGEMLKTMLDQRKDFILKLNTTEVMMDFDPEAQTYRIRPLGSVPNEVILSLNRFVNDYSLIARVRDSRHTTLNALVQELQQSQSSF